MHVCMHACMYVKQTLAITSLILAAMYTCLSGSMDHHSSILLGLSIMSSGMAYLILVPSTMSSSNEKR